MAALKTQTQSRRLCLTDYTGRVEEALSCFNRCACQTKTLGLYTHTHTNTHIAFHKHLSIPVNHSISDKLYQTLVYIQVLHAVQVLLFQLRTTVTDLVERSSMSATSHFANSPSESWRSMNFEPKCQSKSEDRLGHSGWYL